MTETPDSPQGEKPPPRSVEGWGIGLALGTGIGVSIGFALDNLALGIGIGLAIGLAFALAFGAAKKPSVHGGPPDPPSEERPGGTAR